VFIDGRFGTAVSFVFWVDRKKESTGIPKRRLINRTRRVVTRKNIINHCLPRFQIQDIFQLSDAVKQELLQFLLQFVDI
jgi:hypothetical protein